jgi:uncharacterized Fe-S cluster-containing radical SAM superfamily protein
MKGLDPLVQGLKVLPRIYEETANTRLVRRLRCNTSYCGCTTIDVIGCNMLCGYCYVATDFLVGRGKQLQREMKKKDGVRPCTPAELAARTMKTIRENDWPKRIQITAGEPFLTPKWLIDLLGEIAPFSRKNKSQVWIDTNGIGLCHDPAIIDQLLPFADFARIFVSSKNAPPLYTKTTRNDPKYADDPFRAVEMLWKKGIFALLQAPMPNLWDPATFPWYLDRLRRMHPAMPLLLEVDNMHWLPVAHIAPSLHRLGWRTFQTQAPIREGWQGALEKHYGRKMKRLVDVDKFPEDQNLLPQLVFAGGDIMSCHLFS